MENDPIRALILRRMREKNMSEMALSQAIGKNSAYINQFLKRGIPEKLSEDTRYDIARVLGLDEQSLVLKRNENDKNKKSMLKSSTAGSREEVHYGPDTIPVLGTAHGANDAIIVNFDHQISRVMRHPNQANVKNAYAVVVYGDSMAPRLRHGEKAFVAGDVQPTKGQDCLLEMNDGTAYVKIFCKKTDKEVVCEQLNPEKEFRRQLKDVKSINAVVGHG